MNLYDWFVLKVISPFQWGAIKALFNGGVYWELTEQEHDHIRRLLVKDYYIILTRRKTHLTTYLIAIGNLIKTRKFGYWSHALMNLEDEALEDHHFRFIEAVGKGVSYTTFMGVFDCDSVALLKPKHFSIEEWTDIMDKAKEYYGRPYDTLFNIANDNKLSCVELVRQALKACPEYEVTFQKFEEMIAKARSLTPDMFYSCSDFEIVWETRH